MSKAMDLQLFGMKNKDLDAKNDIELQEELKEAIENGDSEAFVKAQVAMAKELKKGYWRRQNKHRPP